MPKEYKQQVADNLAIRVKSDGLDVGLLGTKAILQALSDGGHGEVAYALASRKTYPSWGWWIMNGATTLFENWPIDAKSDISMNHIMFGEIGAWYYKALGGIRPESAGFQKILVKPFIPRELERFSVELESPLGKIVSGWEGRNYTLEIPDGVEAELHVPKEFVGGSKVLKLKAGRHTFKVEP